MVDIINRLTVQGVSQGLDKVAADLVGVADAQKNVGIASTATATITDATSRKVLSAAAAYDRLLRSLDPAYAATQKLASAQRLLGRASGQGIDVSFGEQIIANTKLLQGMGNAGAAAMQKIVANERLIAGMGAAGVTAIGRLGSVTRNAANDTKQLSFQLFDIAQGIPLVFQSPLYGIQNLAVQVGQVSQLFIGRGGLKQAFADTIAIARGLGASLISALSGPFGAILLIVGAAAAGITALFVNESRHAKAAEEALKEHVDLIGRIKDAYKEAGDAVTRFGAESIGVLQDLDAKQRQIVQQQLTRQAIQISSGSELLTSMSAGDATTNALLKLNEEAQKGADNWKEFGDALHKALSDPSIGPAAQTIIHSLEAIAAANSKLQQSNRPFSIALPGPMTPAMQKPADMLPEILKQRAEMERIKLGLASDLIAISAKSPADIGTNATLRERINLRDQDMSSAKKEALAVAAGTIAQAQAEFAITEAVRHRKVARDAAVESAQLETSLVGKSIGEQERLRAQLQMTQEAKQAAADAGTIVSDAEIAQINAAAAALGKLVEEQQRKQLMLDVGFDKSQLFRSPIEQDVADQLRRIFAEDWESHLKGAEAGLIRLTHRLSDLNEVGNAVTHDLVSGLFEGIEKGQSAFEALASAGESALQRIQSKLEDVLADRLWAMLFKSLGGSFFGGGVAAPVSAGLFHSGGIAGSSGPMRYVHPAYFDDAPRMHRGGLAGNEVPAILQRGERVLPRGAGGGGVHVTINNNAGVKVQTQDNGVDGNGVRQLGVAIDAMVGEAIKKRSRPQMMRR